MSTKQRPTTPIVVIPQWIRPLHTPTEYFVYSAMVEHGDTVEETGDRINIKPTRGRLAALTGLSISTVQRAMDALRASGALIAELEIPRKPVRWRAPRKQALVSRVTPEADLEECGSGDSASTSVMGDTRLVSPMTLNQEPLTMSLGKTLNPRGGSAAEGGNPSIMEPGTPKTGSSSSDKNSPSEAREKTQTPAAATAAPAPPASPVGSADAPAAAPLRIAPFGRNNTDRVRTSSWAEWTGALREFAERENPKTRGWSWKVAISVLREAERRADGDRVLVTEAWAASIREADRSYRFFQEETMGWTLARDRKASAMSGWGAASSGSLSPETPQPESKVGYASLNAAGSLSAGSPAKCEQCAPYAKGQVWIGGDPDMPMACPGCNRNGKRNARVIADMQEEITMKTTETTKAVTPVSSVAGYRIRRDVPPVEIERPARLEEIGRERDRDFILDGLELFDHDALVAA